MPGYLLHQLHSLWLERQDEYLGTLFNEYLARGASAYGFKIGESYVDVGTLNGYREALRLLDGVPLKA
jgi:NDP-sugar pyrophosphorylase family protein